MREFKQDRRREPTTVDEDIPVTSASEPPPVACSTVGTAVDVLGGTNEANAR